MITEREIRQFDDAGAVTIDTPLTAQQIAGAAAALDRLLPFREPRAGEKPQFRPSMTCSYYDPELIAIIEHPFFEEVAKSVLRANQVHFFQTAITLAYPQPDTPWSFEQHVDIQYGLSDFQATPKRIICSYFLWLTDVNERRAPMMVCPGSHLLIAEDRERQAKRTGDVPQAGGVSRAQLPALDYGDPLPIVAKAGQVSVLTTATVHGASVNADTVPRKNLVITFTAEGVQIGLPPEGERQRQDYNHRLKQCMAPERAHIVPEG